MAQPPLLQRLFTRLRSGISGLAAALLLALPAMPGSASAAGVEFHRGDGMVWTISDINFYTRNKAHYDGMVRNMAKAVAPMKTWLGEFAPNPVYVHVNEGRCGMSYLPERAPGSKARTVQFGDSCIVSFSNQIDSWLIPNVLHWVSWEVFTSVSGGWPGPAVWEPASHMLQLEMVRQSMGAAEADRLLAQHDTEEKRKRILFYRSLQQAHGWTFLQSLLAETTADKIDWGRIETVDSPMRLNYVLAYQSLGLNLKVGNRAKDGGIGDVSNASVMRVLRARNLLAIADRKGINTNAAWEAYRTGKPDQVISLLPSP